jgi:hypothetical protein
VREHLCRVVDRGDHVAARCELVRDAAGAAAELEDGRAWRDDRSNEVRLARFGELAVDLDGAPVLGDLDQRITLR